MVGPGATLAENDAYAASSRPPTEAPMPSSIAATRVALNDREQLLRRGDRHDHQGRDQQQADGTHRHGHRDGGEDRDGEVVGRDPQPRDPGELGIVGHREQLGRQADAHHDHDGGERDRHPHVRRGDRGDRAEQVGLQQRGALPAEAGQQHAARQAAVEHQRQRDVAVGVAAAADQLDRDGPEGGDDHGGPRGGGAGDQAERDAGHRHVADAVAHQREAALHEVGAHRGCGQAREHRGQEGALHEVEGEEVPEADHRRSTGESR